MLEVFLFIETIIEIITVSFWAFWGMFKYTFWLVFGIGAWAVSLVVLGGLVEAYHEYRFRKQDRR